MSGINKFIFICGSACLLAAISVMGATMVSTNDTSAAPEPLTLADAQRYAVEDNWDILAAKSQVDAATAQLLLAREFPNPTLSLSTAKIGRSYAGTTEGNDAWGRNYDSIAAVNQFIEIAGKRHDRQLAARAGVLSAKARFMDAKRTLEQGMAKTYITALFAMENARSLAESAGYMRHEANIAEQQHAAGDLSEADMKTIEINADQFELQAKSAEAAAVQARIAVQVLMGENRPDGNWKPGDSLEYMVATVPQGGESETATNEAARPDVLAAQTDLRAASENLKLQKAERIPDPTLSVGVEHEPPGGAPGPDANTLNVGVSFPLPLWNQNKGNIQAAQAVVVQSRIALAQIQAQATADLANAKSEYNEAYLRWLRYRDQTAPKSAQVRATMEYKYEKGAATLLDLLNAEQTDNTVRLALAQAMNDTASAVADLTAAQAAVTETEVEKE